LAVLVVNNGTQVPAFQGITSNVIFTSGSFNITSNLNSRSPVDFSTTISSFATPITLNDLNLSSVQSQNIINNSNNCSLNLDDSNLFEHVKFGSCYQFFISEVQGIILNYPYSLYVNNNIDIGGNVTFFNFIYNPQTNISTFSIPIQYLVNNYGFIYNMGNNNLPANNSNLNLNINYGNYVIFDPTNGDNSHTILGFTGNTTNITYIGLSVLGNCFPILSGTTLTAGRIPFHIKPTPSLFQDFYTELDDFQQYILADRNSDGSFSFVIKNLVLLDDGEVISSPMVMNWPSSDGYNIDISGFKYSVFFNSLMGIGTNYDQIKTNLIARALVPQSIIKYDNTDQGKMSILLQVYGWEFDQIQKFIDGLLYINTVTYDKKNNLPDQIVQNLANTLGWEYFNIINESELMDSLFLNTQEPTSGNSLLPSQINIELWRRILINTNYLWKSKGTRHAVEAILLMLGIPSMFLNISEFIYLVDNKINPNTVTISLSELSSPTLPYDSNGYPITPIENNNYYFQVSGDSDSGQAYFKPFKVVGFDLLQQVDNIKSWVAGQQTHSGSTTPTYFVEDDRLILNTKEVDVSLDSSQAIEYDVYNYIKTIDYPMSSSGYTLNFDYVNINVSQSSTTTFNLPQIPTGNVEVRVNGILLSAPSLSGSTYLTNADYTISGNTVTLNSPLQSSDIIEITYLYKIFDLSYLQTVSYLVTRITPALPFTSIILPQYPKGDAIQLTLNGIALSQNQGNFTNGDFSLIGNEILITNPSITSIFLTTDIVQVAFVTGDGSIREMSEVVQVNSFNLPKFSYSPELNLNVLTLNYQILNTDNVKILVNGIAILPYTDYYVNSNNNYQIFITNNISLGDIITAYYIIGNGSPYTPIISPSFGLGDITKLSFLEFIDLIQKKLINATNHKIITDYRGGFYPQLLYVYAQYFNRSLLSNDNPFKSNGYTFNLMLNFVNKYSSYFMNFVDSLLPATAILRKSGILIRNTCFVRTKFKYPRGVSFDESLNYFGNNDPIYLRRLSSQSVFWTDDYVENLSPITGTTHYPVVTGGTFTTIISLVQDSLINSGNTQTCKFHIALSSNLPIGDNLQIKLKLNSTISGNTASNQQITLNKNTSIVNNINIPRTGINYLVFDLQNNDVVEINVILNSVSNVTNGMVVSIEEANINYGVITINSSAITFTKNI